MLSKDHRFHGYGGLRFVYRHGQTIRGQHLALRYAVNNRANYRCSVVVSRSVSKSAVVRNRIRRRIYELIAQRLSATKTPYDLVVTALQPEIADWPAAQLSGVIDKLLAKAGLTDVSTDAQADAKDSHAIINIKGIK